MGESIEQIQTTRRRWEILAVLCAGLFMLLLDGTIVNIAIPSVMEDFRTGFSEIEWVMNAYLLVFAVLLITMGRLGDLYGRRLLFTLGLVLFTTASLACGLAPGIGWLIGFRALQGLGAAAMMPSTLSIVATVFPGRERGAAMGIWGAVSGFALSVGPSLGGVLTEYSTWRAIFLINVPIGLLVVALTLRLVPETRDPTSSRRLDWPGLVILSASLFALTFALIEGQKLGWRSSTILGLFVAAALGLALFVLVERRQPEPLMQLALFRSRNFTVANVAGGIMSFGMMGIFFLLPVFLQAILGYSAIKAGLVLTPLAAIVMVAAPTAGWLSDRIGSRWLISVGMAVAAVGFWLIRGQMSLDATWYALIVPFMVSGFGIGMVIPPMTSVVMASAPTEKAGQASGILSTVRQLGSVLGIAVMGAILQNRAALYLEEAVNEKLAPLPFLSDEAKESIVSSAGSAMTSMGEMRAPGGASGPPGGISETLARLPAEAQAAIGQLFGREFVMGEFVHAMQTTIVVATVFLLVGSVVATFLRSHVVRE